MSFSLSPLLEFYNKKEFYVPIIHLLNNDMEYKEYSYIDGYYLKFIPSMIKNGSITQKHLIKMVKKYKIIGIWGLEEYEKDNRDTINKLIEMGVKYVNTNEI